MTKVMVKHSFTIEEEWDDKYATKEHIELYYNEGTSCADNIMQMIENYKDSIGASCMCPLQSSEVIEIKSNDPN